MVKFQATHDNGRKLLGLGLSHANVQKLKDGHPIHFNAEDLGLTTIAVSEVLIFVGETEDSIRREFEAKGYLDGVRIIEESRTKQ